MRILQQGIVMKCADYNVAATLCTWVHDTLAMMLQVPAELQE